MLNQPQYPPLPVEEQVVAIYAATKGYLDKVPVAEVQRFLAELISELRGTTTVLDDIKGGELSDETVATMEANVTSFKESFSRSRIRPPPRRGSHPDGIPAGHQAPICSVKNTEKITKAMKLVAASRLRRARPGSWRCVPTPTGFRA